MKLDLLNIENKKTDVQISESTFGKEFNETLVHQAVVTYLAGSRQGSHKQKTRSEVRGGGKKPYRQKGTGRARAGSNRSPLWRGGGVIFGPKPKQTVLKLNKKERKLALQTLLYNKRNNISVIENLENAIESAKTKTFFNICKNCGVDLNQKVLVVVSKKTPALKLSIRNMKNVELISASNLNTLSILKAKQILLTPLAVNEIKETYCG